jgi:multicomponent Na+:H+ antiporter subunit E
MRFARRVALLVVLWLLAWGAVTVANVLSGIVVATLLLLAFPPGERRPSAIALRPAGIARLAAHVTSQLVVSNVQMAVEIVRHRPQAAPGVLRHQLQVPSDEVVTVMTSIIALSPGTMTVDVAADSSTVWVHFYRLADVAGARAGLARLEALVREATAPRREPEPELEPDGAGRAPASGPTEEPT